MIARYHAVLLVWDRRNGGWNPVTLGRYKTRDRAARRLLQVERHYTRYERHRDEGEIVDVKREHGKGRYTPAPLNTYYDVPTVGDLGWTP